MTILQRLNCGDSILIIGLGKTGFCSARFFANLGLKVRVMDQSSSPKYLSEIELLFPQIELCCGTISISWLQQATTIVLSPGISPYKSSWLHPYLTKVVSDVELFCRCVDANVIAVTGTNGKTTVTSMLQSALNNLGYKTAMGANNDNAVLQLLDYTDIDYYILELSSFQLDLTISMKTKVSALLNISSDHLDWHLDSNNYTEAKAKIFSNADIAICHNDVVKKIQINNNKLITFSSNDNKSDFSVKVVGDESFIKHKENKLISTSNLTLQSAINIDNYLAVFAIMDALGIESDQYIKASNKFSGLAHRCQYLGNFSSRFWYNDSKATNSAAVTAALASLAAQHKNIVLLVGGIFKEEKSPIFSKSLYPGLDTIIAYGENTQLLLEEVDDNINIKVAKDLCSAIDMAYAESKRQAAIILSPCCASFDHFDNYVHRGEIFTNYVKKHYEHCKTD